MDNLPNSALAKICRTIYRDYPEYQDALPKVTKQGDENYLLIFEKKMKTEDGNTLKLTLRVLADSNGKILKVSGSK